MPSKMRTEHITLTVGADLSAGVNKFATMDADGKLSLTGAGGASVGVILTGDGDADGKSVKVQPIGVAKVMAGTGDLSAGDLVAAEAGGQGVTAAVTDTVLGIALEDISDDAVGDVLITLNGGELNA